MMKFGILSDILGQRDDIPSIKLPQGYACGESEWMIYEDSVMRRLPGRYKEFLDANGDAVAVTDANPILRWHYHVSPSGTEYILAFTKAHIYRWDGGSKVWDQLFACSANCTHWSSADFGKYVVATNNVDKVISWADDTPSTDFAVLGDPTNGIQVGTATYLTKAEFVIECENYLLLMSVTEGGTTRRNRRVWGTWGDLTDFNRDGSGDCGYNDLEGNRRIKGCGILSLGQTTRLITFTQNLVDVMWLTTEDVVWQSETLWHKPGCAATDSVVNDGSGELYYLATDRTIRAVSDNRIVSGDIAPTIRNLHPSLAAYSQAVCVQQMNHLWWSVPSGPSSANNDLVLMLNLNSGTWHKAPMDICAFGYWTGQVNFQIDTIPFDTVDTIEWPFIDWAGQVSEYPFLICSDYTGKGYRAIQSQTDKGTVYAAKLILASDMTSGQALTEYKRIHGMWFYFDRGANDGDTVAVSLQGDGGEGYETVGVVDLEDIGLNAGIWLPCDTRFRTCKLKLEADNPFDFIGVIFDYDFDGDA